MATEAMKVSAKIGDSIKGDEWKFAEVLTESDGYSDACYAGCQFRVELYGKDINLGVNVITTGMPKWNGSCYQSRCKVVVPGDCEPDTVFGGTLYHLESMFTLNKA